MREPFITPHDAALAALNHGVGLNRRSGQFLGQLVGDKGYPLSPKQVTWLAGILDRAGLPPLHIGGDA